MSPTIFIQHNDVRNLWPLISSTPAFSSRLRKAIDDHLPSLNNTVASEQGVLCGEYDLGMETGVWRLNQNRMSSGKEGDLKWKKHVYDVVPISGCGEGAQTFTSGWSSLTWELKSLPPRIHPLKNLFKGKRFLLLQRDFEEDRGAAPLCHELDVVVLLSAFGGSVTRDISCSFDYYLGSGSYSLRMYDTVRFGKAPLTDIHWVFACLSLHRLLPTEPFLVSRTAPFASSEGLLLPCNPAQSSHLLAWRQSLHDGVVNARAELSVALLPVPLQPTLHPLKGVKMRDFDAEEGPWCRMLTTLLFSLFEELGGETARSRKEVNYTLEEYASLDAILKQTPPIVNGSWEHFLATIANAELLSTSLNPTYQPVPPGGRRKYHSIMADLEINLLQKYFTPSDIEYLVSMIVYMGGSCRILSGNDSVDEGCITPYVIPNVTPSDAKPGEYVTPRWIEEICRCKELLPMDDYIPTELAPTGSFKPVPMKRLWPKRPSLEERYQDVCEAIDDQMYRDLLF